MLVLDEVGYLPLSRAEGSMVFQLVSRPYERGAMILTSNKTSIVKRSRELQNFEHGTIPSALGCLGHGPREVTLEVVLLLRGQPMRWYLGLALLSLCSAALLVQSSPARSYFGDRTGGSAGDFLARYAAGRLLKMGLNPYDNEVLLRKEVELVLESGASSSDGPLPIYDPPPVLLIFRALAELPMIAATWLWWILSTASLAGTVLLLSQTMGLRWHLPVLLAGAALFGPAWHSLMLGQIDLVLLLPFWVAMAWRERAWTPGVATFALLKPQLALVPVLYMIGRTRSLHGLLGVLLAASVTLLLGIVTPGATWTGWLNQMVSQPSELTSFDRVANGLVATAGCVTLVFAAKTIRQLSLSNRLAVAAATNGLLGGIVRWNPQWLLVAALPALHELSRAPRSGTRHRLVVVAAAAILLTGGQFAGAWRVFVGAEGQGYVFGQLLVVSMAVAALGVVERIPMRWVLGTIALHVVVVFAPRDPGWGLQLPSVLVGALLLYAAVQPPLPARPGTGMPTDLEASAGVSVSSERGGPS